MTVLVPEVKDHAQQLLKLHWGQMGTLSSYFASSAFVLFKQEAGFWLKMLRVEAVGSESKGWHHWLTEEHRRLPTHTDWRWYWKAVTHHEHTILNIYVPCTCALMFLLSSPCPVAINVSVLSLVSYQKYHPDWLCVPLVSSSPRTTFYRRTEQLLLLEENESLQRHKERLEPEGRQAHEERIAVEAENSLKSTDIQVMKDMR